MQEEEIKGQMECYKLVFDVKSLYDYFDMFPQTTKLQKIGQNCY